MACTPPLTCDYAQKVQLLRALTRADENEDVHFRPLTVAGREGMVIYLDGMADGAVIARCVIFPCQRAAPPPEDADMADHLQNTVLPVEAVTHTMHAEQVLDSVFSGDAALLCPGMEGALLFDVKGFTHRPLGQATGETVLTGSHEGFNESLKDNLVLLRRMMHTPELICETLTVGDRIPKKTALVYLASAAPAETVAEMRRRLRLCRTDYVADMGVLEQLLEDQPFALLPQALAIERPDRVCSFLVEGQLILLMENAPYALVMPCTLTHQYHSPDDTSLRWQYGSFLRLIRLAGMLLSLTLPALYIALSLFHLEGMPVSLMTSVLEGQSRVPLSLFFSMVLMMLVFNLINEASARVPGILGSGVSIVSGLILGQAAITADLVSPLVIVVVALSGLGCYTAPNYALTLSLLIAQLFLLILAGLMGLVGLIGGLFFLAVQACGLQSLGYPAALPVSPVRPANPDTVLRLPIWRQRLRGALASPRHMRRVDGSMRAWAQHGRRK